MKIIFVIFFFLLSFHSFSHHPGHKIEANTPYPSINLKIIKDNIDGYNLHIDLKNFNLEPSQVGKENQTNTGYLNLYVNDIKITRVYSNWVHIPQRFLNLKENFIKITVNTNLHDVFVIEGKPIKAEIKIISN